MADDIKLPPLPYPQIPGNDYDPKDMQEYARAAIKADRQRRGEPAAYRSWRRDIARWEYHSKRTEDITCEPLYAAPQSPDPLVKDYLTAPDGWQLVPIEPNSPMEAAAEDYWNGLRYSAFSKSPSTWAGVYGSMLAAAPKFGEEE